jgi:alcohol dehydrogenase, propanol-preferring
MRAMQLRSPRSLLEMADLDMPRVGPGQLLVKVHACGVCRTDLHGEC